eukprot:TRINITY_DN34028_c0_g1_i1.p1 TRINITY_DN34028_c0_g1~~TRINITY_DN34028_c0_g1_i1.p1  ORF type:complete len:266 (+),score=74.07 TRINITY_DN34028_c0_g1_i1:55-852(+)
MAGDPAEGTGDGGNVVPAEQLAEAQCLMDELPRIETALKNFLSLRMAESLAPKDVQAGAEGSDAPTAATLQGCARVLLKTLNALELPPVAEWSQRHGQGSDEGGVDYMTRLGSYKVVRSLWARSRSAGQKPAKMLGRKALNIALPEVTSEILKNCQASATAAGASQTQLETFLEDFTEICMPTQDDEAATGEDPPKRVLESGLVWAKDMKAAIAERQVARRNEAAARASRAVDADKFSAEMRAALAGTGEDMDQATSKVTIEEVD